MKTIKKLTGHEYAQCHVEIFDSGSIYFFSYQTMIALIAPDEPKGERWLYISHLCSPTTRKQLGWFLKEYCDMRYQTAKDLYYNNERYCLDTGEIESLN